MSQSDPTLLLIHGLGATAGTWSGVIDAVRAGGFDGRIVAPDLPGHGTTPWTGRYTVGELAAAVSSECEEGEPVVIVGHSLGGAVGICLASGWYRPTVGAVVGLGIKATWTDDDVAGMASVAARGIRWFESRDDAVNRYLRQSGLDGIPGVGSDHPATANAVVAEARANGLGWRVSQDPLTFAQQALDMAGLMAAAKAPVILGAGAGDAMAPEADLAAYVDQPRIAADRGHNVQVEDPAWVAGLITEAISGQAS